MSPRTVLLLMLSIRVNCWGNITLKLPPNTNEHMQSRLYSRPLNNTVRTYRPPTPSDEEFVSMVNLLRLFGICVMFVNQIFIYALYARLFTVKGQQEDWEDFLEESNEGLHLTDHAEKIKKAVLENLAEPVDAAGGAVEAVPVSIYQGTTMIVNLRRKPTAMARSTERASLRKAPMEKKTVEELPKSKERSHNEGARQSKIDAVTCEEAPKRKDTPAVVKSKPESKKTTKQTTTTTNSGDQPQSPKQRTTKIVTDKSVSLTAQDGEFAVDQTPEHPSAEPRTEKHPSGRLPRAPKGNQANLLRDMEDIINDEDLAKELDDDRKKYIGNEKEEKEEE